MAKVDVKYPFVNRPNPLLKHGLGKDGHQRYWCQMFWRTFQLNYAYRDYQPCMKEQIVDFAINNASI